MPNVQFHNGSARSSNQLNAMNLGLSVVVVNGGPEDDNARVIGSNPRPGAAR